MEAKEILALISGAGLSTAIFNETKSWDVVGILKTRHDTALREANERAAETAKTDN